MATLAVAVLSVACSADPAPPPFEAGGSGSVPAAGGNGAGTGGAASGSSAGQAGAGGSGAAAGIGSGSSGSAGQAVTFAQINTLIPGACGGNLCHTGTQKPSLRNDGALYRTLLDTSVSECGGARLAVPGNPDASAIIQLVNRRCTKLGAPFYMPKDCTKNPCLPSSQLQTITEWIRSGAPGP